MATTTSESEDERMEKKVKKRAQKVGNKRCYMHLFSVKNEDVLDFSTVEHVCPSLLLALSFQPSASFVKKCQSMLVWDRKANGSGIISPKQGHCRQAAEMKKDSSILLHIKDKDCVATEVRYHKSCYCDYTRFLTKPTETATRDEEMQPYAESYKLFCEQVIRQRIIVDKEVFRMDKLRRLFVNTVRNHEDLDASDYRQDMLKRQLKRDFPQLVFHTPFKRNVSEMVFLETLSTTDKLLDRIPQSSGTSATESTEVSQESDTEQMASSSSGWKTTEQTRTLYSAGLILRTILSKSPGLKCPWPPTAEDLNVCEAKAVVPVELYNLISWIIGATEEPTLAGYVDIPDDVNLKVISLCQEIVYLESKGRKQTPKSLCLGLTVRHLTGSSNVLSLLNKLGHCSSWDTVVSLDTSLAQLSFYNRVSSDVTLKADARDKCRALAAEVSRISRPDVSLDPVEQLVTSRSKQTPDKCRVLAATSIPIRCTDVSLHSVEKHLDAEAKRCDVTRVSAVTVDVSLR
ncbi:uncharacterized protein LOC130928664 [Corythoichthys intestinalis]|uniref:uncharacterized protein LOC130928664 n=1 Tax=Corythoichthys intestinalis TaxID=161448 RepID=UPI0025A6382B|nr:uncharacterized protein LOC130928664 [Corythoichthys intestinalis]